MRRAHQFALLISGDLRVIENIFRQNQREVTPLLHGVKQLLISSLISSLDDLTVVTTLHGLFQLVTQLL